MMRFIFLLCLSIPFIMPQVAVSLARADDSCARGFFCSFTGTYVSLDTLTIAPPNEFVYALVDGYNVPHQFPVVRAKIKSAMQGVTVGAGNVWALAVYKKRTDYIPNLFTGPPSEELLESEYSYSRSVDIAVSGLSETAYTDVEFDFSAAPIPAGIVDLKLFVFFTGAVAGLDIPMTLTGTKDLNEPMHLVFINSTDKFYLDGVLYTGQEIRDDINLRNRVDLDGDGAINEIGPPPMNHSLIHLDLNWALDLPPRTPAVTHGIMIR